MRCTTNGRRWRGARRWLFRSSNTDRASLLRSQRHGEQASRLVEHDQRIVLVDDRQICDSPSAGRRVALPGRSIQSADDVAGGQTRARGIEPASSPLTNTLPRSSAAAARGARSGAIGGGEELVEPDADVARAGRPQRVRHTGPL